MHRRDHSANLCIDLFTRLCFPYLVLRQVHSLSRMSLHKVRSGAFSFNFQYPRFSLRSFTGCLHLLRISFTPIPPSIVPSITCFRRQFLRKMWPVQLAFLHFVLCVIFLYLTLCNTSSFLTRSFPMIDIFLQHHISKLSNYLLSTFRSVQNSAPHKAFLQMSVAKY